MPFADIVGHQRLVQLLSRAAARDSLPPTLLFAGPPGVGKWLTARALAAAANCLTPVTGGGTNLPLDACGQCRACDRIARGVHVDVMALEPDEKGAIKVDAIRDVLGSIGYKPFEGRRRVVLIREADALIPAAQHALLKSLEEPPPATSFVLTTAVPGALLPTVRSRAMRLAFGRLGDADVAAVLAAQGIEAEEARAAAALAGGSAGQALALGTADLAAIHETALLALQQTAARGGVAPRLQTAGLIAAPGSRKDRPRGDIRLIFRAMASLLRDIEVLNGGGDARLLANPADAAVLARLQPAFTGDRAREAFQAVNGALDALRRNAGAKVVAEWLTTRI